MVEPDIYCKVSGMTMGCIAQLNREGRSLPHVVEVGCADGQGTMRYAGFCSSVVAVDAMVSGRPDIVSLTKETMQVDQSKLDEFKRRTKDFNVNLVIGCSLWEETISAVKDHLAWNTPDGLADIVVIDGCHHPFEAVWADVEAYHPLVRPGGFMVLDDLYEDCIIQVYEKMQPDLGYEPFDRWSIRNPKILQDCAALRRLS